MKRNVSNYLFIAAFIISAVFTSCGGGGGIGGGSYKIKMTTEKGGDFDIRLYGSGVATVDWGDGSEKVSLTLNEDGVRFGHDYPSTTIRTININGDNITGLSCDYITSLDVSKNSVLTILALSSFNLTSLDVSKNTALTELGVYYSPLTSLDLSKNTALTYLNLINTQLTSLDVSKNTALTYLRVDGNKLTSSALNTLFGTLHSNSGEKRIYIYSNPGAEDCNKNIAESKGWMVNPYY